MARSSRETTEPVPDVSVIVPAHDAMPYLVRCLDSVLAQSLGTRRMELIAVDDGSKDGTGAELDRRAAAHPDLFRVFHQPASGTPAAPRNKGLDVARGRFVYFLDADDYLGPQALERLLKAAEKYGADVVLGKMQGTNGRGVPRSMFRRNQPDADLFESRVYWTLGPMKLFRRDLIEQHHIRFPTDLPNASDQLFTATAYLRAGRISVVADYDCYFAVRREDGKHVTKSGNAANRVANLERMCDLLGREVPAGYKREQLLHRHFQVEMSVVLKMLAREKKRATQQALLARVGQVVRTHLTPSLGRRLARSMWLQCHLAGRELLDELIEVVNFERAEAPYDVTVENGRCFAHFPYFRDSRLAIPDECFDITDHLAVSHELTSYSFTGSELVLTGTATLRRIRVTDDTKVEIVVRERDTEAPEYSSVAGRTAADGFEARLDIDKLADGRPLPDGVWELFVRVTLAGITRTARLGANHPAELDVGPTRLVVDDGEGGVRAAAAYFTSTYGNLNLALGEGKFGLHYALRPQSVQWEGSTLRVKGSVDLANAVSVTGCLVERGGTVRTGSGTLSDGRFDARLPVGALPRGLWTVHIRIGTAEGHVDLPVEHQPSLTGIRSWKLPRRPSYAKPLTGTENLTLRVDSLKIGSGLWRRFSRARRR